LEATARHSAGGSVAFGITPGQQEDCPCDLVSGLGQKQCKGNPHEPVRRRRLQGNNVQPCQAGDNRDKANTRPCKYRGGPEAPWPWTPRRDRKRTARVTWFPVWGKNSARAIHRSPSGGDVFKATTSNHAKQATTAIRPTPDHANVAEGGRCCCSVPSMRSEP